MYDDTYRQTVPTQRKMVFDGLFDCQEAFYAWYDTPDIKPHAPAVAAFEALRVILATSQNIAISQRIVEARPDCLKTVQRLERDIDEIVGVINAHTREESTEAAPAVQERKADVLDAVKTSLAQLKVLSLAGNIFIH